MPEIYFHRINDLDILNLGQGSSMMSLNRNMNEQNLFCQLTSRFKQGNGINQLNWITEDRFR